MAPTPLLQLNNISLTFGGNPLFSGLDLVIQPGDRLALVGRNGSGKSTLMKIMAGLAEADTGARILTPGSHVGYMEQDPDFSGFATLGDYAMQGLDPSEGYKVEIAAEGLSFDPAVDAGTASGGERRRAALAKLLAEAPDLMLLDEPTNHLDIHAIGWLEARLRETRKGFVLISHDRAFLNALSRAMLWVDRGAVRRLEQGFAAFEEWRDKTWADEDDARHKLDRKIKHEAKWAVEGISARRKRNMGRVRALQDLKADRAGQIRRQGTAAMALDAGPQSGKLVVEATGISKRFDDTVILRDFSLKVLRGDRIAFVGPNGAGKTTMLNLLTGAMQPDSGTIRLGTNLAMAVFDQTRAKLDPNATLWENLTGDPMMRVSGQADQVMVRGQPKHVVGYLKEFLFDESQARAPVRSLSGGERARLLLARIMARESNLLVLDEPTNDLDVETLDLLQDILGDYPGTVLLVSHDRDFIDRVATTTLAFEGQGDVTVYAGGWSDYQTQKALSDTSKQPATRAEPSKSAGKPASRQSKAPDAATKGLSFTERKRLEALPNEIARLEAEIGKLSELLSDADLYTREPVKAARASDALEQRQQALGKAEEEWLDLEDRA